MKKFWEKYKVLIIIIVAVCAFVSLSLLSEKRVETTKMGDIAVWAEEAPASDFAITIIALSYCDHCKEFNPIITEVAKEYSIPIYWFEYDLLDAEGQNTLVSTFDFTEYEGASPYMAITKKNEVVAQNVGKLGKEATIEFLKTNNIIK